MLALRPLNVRKLLLLSVIPASIVVVRSLPGWLGAISVSGPGWGSPEGLTKSLFGRLAHIPDVTLIVLYGMVCGTAYVAIRIKRDRSLLILSDSNAEARSKLICLSMPFFFSAGVLVLVLARESLFLPRYLIPVLPFSLVSMLLLAQLIARERIAFGVIVVSCLVFAINHNGYLYPKNYRSFSIVERSHAYHDFHRLQIEAIDALAAKPSSVPAFVSREVDYMVSHPMMGYVDSPLSNVYPIYRLPHRDRSLEEFPEEFFLLQSNLDHGGQEIARLIRAARDAPRTEIRVRRFERKGFCATLFWIRRNAVEEQEAVDHRAPDSRLE
jgi:hypothetical protein